MITVRCFLVNCWIPNGILKGHVLYTVALRLTQWRSQCNNLRVPKPHTTFNQRAWFCNPPPGVRDAKGSSWPYPSLLDKCAHTHTPISLAISEMPYQLSVLYTTVQWMTFGMVRWTSFRDTQSKRAIYNPSITARVNRKALGEIHDSTTQCIKELGWVDGLPVAFQSTHSL